jgi:hypothetical protein
LAGMRGWGPALVVAWDGVALVIVSFPHLEGS